MPNTRSEAHERLGAAIRRSRREAGLTIEQLGFRASLSPRYVAGVERGEINAALENLLSLVGALDRRLADIAADAAI